MKRNILFPVVLISILVFAEISSYFAIRSFFLENKSQLKIFNYTWFGATIILYILVALSGRQESHFAKNVLVNFFMLFLILKLFIGLVFIVVLIIQFIQSLFISQELNKSDQISRRKFSAQVALTFASVPLFSLIYGIAKTAYDFKIHRVKINSSKMPNAFNGLKIVQISDIHTGSLQGKKQLNKAIDMVNQLDPDVIFFTGDLVNNQSDEALDYLEDLKKLKSKLGIYSILGNHDYGDYYSWNSEQEKIDNMNLMFKIHEDLNWKLLLNENLTLERNDEKIAILGVENWGANLHFKKYGKLDKAYKGSEDIPFKILLSHDPSHWSHEVKDKYPDIDLTLSGHTHGFQLGVEIPGFKWSPSQYIYPQWSGLYKYKEQFLYVNRGLGCIGYMGRIGIKPEITLIELNNKLS